MEKHLGESFEGMITSVTKFGVFVTLRAFDIDGLIRLVDLSDDRLEFDEEKLRLVAQRSGMAYSIGDVVAVQVAAVNITEGQIDFVLDGADTKKRTEQNTDGPRRVNYKGAKEYEKKKGTFKKRRPSEDDHHGVRKKRFPKPRRKK